MYIIFFNEQSSVIQTYVYFLTSHYIPYIEGKGSSDGDYLKKLNINSPGVENKTTVYNFMTQIINNNF